MEIVRMSELPILYRTLYDMDTLPKKVLEELSEMSGQKKGICHGEVCQTLISGICNITKLYHFQSKPSLYLHTSFRLWISCNFRNQIMVHILWGFSFCFFDNQNRLFLNWRKFWWLILKINNQRRLVLSMLVKFQGLLICWKRYVGGVGCMKDLSD